MALMVEELKSSCSQKRGRNTQQQKLILEAIAKGGTVTSYTAEDGSMRMKILVRKQDLKQILNNNNNMARANHNRPSVPSTQSATSSMERRLYDLMKRKRANTCKGMSRLSANSSTPWRPALHSIPEDHC